ncbi:MAG: ABC transporter substrate-binding protein [Suilimivivens sp.]
MKKKICIFSFLLILLAMFAGCGKNIGESQQTVSSKDCVYKITALDLKKGADGYSNIIKNGDYIYAYGYKYEEDGTATINLAALNSDGTLREESKFPLGENGSLMNLACDEQGMIYAIKDIYAMEPDEEGNYIDKYYFVKLSGTGEEIFHVLLNEMSEVRELTENGWFYTQDLLIYNDNIYINIMGSYLVFDKEGGFQKVLTAAGEDSFESVRLYPLENGKVVGLSYEDDGAYLGHVNMETGEISDKTKIPGASYDFSVYAGNTKYELYLVNSYGVYGYNIGDTAMTQLMNYVDSDLGVYSVYNLLPINEQEFWASYDDPETYDTCIGRFTKVDPQDIKDKKILILACTGLDWDIRTNVVEFNKNNEEYRITIQDYSALYASDTDYQAGINRLNTDIVSGKIPDILVLNDSMPIESYIAKGLLEDMKPYIEKDPGLDINNYMPNIIEAYSVDGKLYRLVPSYMISTLLAKTSEVGEERGWTIQDVNRLMSTKPEGTLFLSYVDRKSMLLNCMNMAGNQFIDWETGTCDFDSDDFVEMLEFLKQFPEQVDETVYTDAYWENYDSMWREGRTVAMMYTVSDFRSFNYTSQGSFGEPVTMIGFPSSNRDGSAIIPSMQMAMSAKSSNKEGAWQFLRYYLSDEYQDNISYGFPLSIKKLNDLGEKATKNPTYTDENGNEVETQDYYYLNEVEIPIEPMTKEEVEKFKETLYSFKQIYNYDENLIQIIEEEAAAFFNGQKNAKDVAAIIQSRARIYVNENR